MKFDMKTGLTRGVPLKNALRVGLVVASGSSKWRFGLVALWAVIEPHPDSAEGKIHRIPSLCIFLVDGGRRKVPWQSATGPSSVWGT